MDDRRLDRGRALSARSLAPRVALAVFVGATVGACGGGHEGPGEIRGERVPREVVLAREARARLSPGAGDAANARAPSSDAAASETATAADAKRILFGDLHVHTTFSIDAFALSLPIMQGEGAHPPADACDFARHCSALDFWSINDHAEGLTPEHWRETRDSIRRCNEIAGSDGEPDVVAFLGWEWSQVGDTAETHYGHKNVVLRDLADERVPARPIAAPPRLLAPFTDRTRSLWNRVSVPLYDWANRRRYFDFARFQSDIAGVAPCPDGVRANELPEDCHEVADDPGELFEKLREWGHEAIVIPHGTTWGLYTPPGYSLDKQLAPGQHDPDLERLIEVYSGHGNSEEYRAWTEFTRATGERGCAEPTSEYVPCCWRAGEIIRSRCADASSEECDRRVLEARRNFVAAGHYGHLTVPGTEPADWRDCGQCRDCFNPAFNYRPGGSAQYALAVRRFDGTDAPRSFRFGFIASSDNHSARPGTGYKEYGRLAMTEAAGPPSPAWRSRLAGDDADALDQSIAWTELEGTVSAVRLWEGERQASYFMTGGLAAVHATGRARDAIWSALKRGEVYGTSGDRILLWFDLLNGEHGEAPMGAEAAVAAAPRFRARAAGAFAQLPGCPEHAVRGLAADRLERLCRGECYNPSDRRRLITRIEVVRIRPQRVPGENIRDLIDDPWRTLTCAPDPEGCVVEFDDPEFLGARRETLYYVRAVQEPTLAVNAGGVRCEYDAGATCVRAKPCYGDWRTPADDDCLSSNEERAWSSPIRVLPL